MTQHKYIGIQCPVIDEDGIIVAFRTITACFDCENVAGCFIGLDNKTYSIVTSYAMLEDCVNDKFKLGEKIK